MPENVVLEDIIVDGNRAENDYLDGCRGGAIYLNTVRNCTVRRCVARNYNGDRDLVPDHGWGEGVG